MSIEAAPDAGPSGANREVGEAGIAWRRFVDQFVAQARFDDPAQPAPRRWGTGWIRVHLPGDLYINLDRSKGEQRIGAQVRFALQAQQTCSMTAGVTLTFAATCSPNF